MSIQTASGMGFLTKNRIIKASTYNKSVAMVSGIKKALAFMPL
jgi:hypothetical protein